jgi:prepilin signal peptidase PulO-like enzyme (type II secretory pathway)
MQILILINLVAVALTLVVAAALDLKYRRVPIMTWIPAVFVVSVADTFYYSSIPLDIAIPQFAFSLFFAGVGFAFVLMRFYGGADAIAIMLIAFAFPVNPITEKMQFIVMDVFTIACAAVIVWTLMNLWKNLNAGRKGSLEQLLFALPVKKSELSSVQGWLQGIESADGQVLCTENLTPEVMEDPVIKSWLDQREEVWVTLAMPFLVPVFIGLMISIFYG